MAAACFLRARQAQKQPTPRHRCISSVGQVDVLANGRTAVSCPRAAELAALYDTELCGEEAHL